MRWLALALLVGCYRPAAERACETACTADDPRCPEGMTCGGDLRCRANDAVDCSLDPNIPDAAPLADAQACFGYALPEFPALCPPAVTGTRALGGTINTDDPQQCDQARNQGMNGDVLPAYCAVFAADVTVMSPLQVIGTRPYVIVATHAIAINAAITTIADGNDASCPLPHDGAQDSGGIGGGGAGGAFQGDGGAGGKGQTTSTKPGLGGLLQPGLMQSPTHLRGGCTGGVGAGNVAGGGTGGGGGGALYLIAGTRIDINGAIDASGAGGGGGDFKTGGGGGGGAGGMIVLEAPTVTIGAAVFADGGGGGGGTGTGDGGMAGGVSTGMGDAAGGMGGTVNGGFGGTGSSRTSIAGVAAINATAGGGGGGGGGGYVFIRATHVTGDGLVSPPPLP